MTTIKQTPHQFMAALACLALLACARPATAQLIITTSNQTGSPGVYPFTPTWTPAASSLIAGVAPTVAVGDFSVELTGRNVLSLTAGGSLAISEVIGDSDDSVGTITTDTNYVTGGNSNGNQYFVGADPGSLLVYPLPASANGYNVTNITVYSGWADSGRDAQAYTILYSTVANPGHFLYLTNVSYNPTVAAGSPSANRVVISKALSGVIASNVDSVEFLLNAPASENGFVGYGAITIQGKPATIPAASPVISVAIETESGGDPFTPDWTLETNSLIAGLEPVTATGNFMLEGSAGASILTDGLVGNSGDISGFATCGAGSGSGSTLIYALTNVITGADVTNIVTYSGWGNEGRAGQYYIVSYSTVSAPATFIPITTVCVDPAASDSPANRVSISKSDGSPLARKVANIKFDFATPALAASFNNGYQGYSEIIVQGQSSVALPPVIGSIHLVGATHTVTVSGTGQAGQSYVLLGATNMVAPVWTSVLTTTADGSGNFSFSNVPATGAQGYYRVSGN